MPTPIQTIADAVTSAQSILAEYVPSEGISAEQALDELLGVLDSRTLIAAQRAHAGPYQKGVEQDHLTRRSKVIFDLLRKYGVLVDPDSLSEDVITRLYPRINYPRMDHGYTLRDWSDTVLGEGEQVRFLLPQSPRRNTHLATVQHLSREARNWIGELIDSVETEGTPGEASAQTPITTQEALPAADMPAAEQPAFSLEDEAEAITSGGDRGLNTLHSLKEFGEEEGRWSPAVLECITKLLDKHDGDEEIDTVDAMTELVDRIDVMVRKAREILDKEMIKNRQPV